MEPRKKLLKKAEVTRGPLLLSPLTVYAVLPEREHQSKGAEQSFMCPKNWEDMISKTWTEGKIIYCLAVVGKVVSLTELC